MDSSSDSFDIWSFGDYGGRDGSAPAHPDGLLFAARCALALTLFFLLWAGLEYRRACAFEAEAVEVQATVTSKWKSSHYRVGRRSGYRSSTRHKIDFNFHDLKGVAYSYREALSVSRWNTLSVGAVVPVWYVPSEPANHALFERWRAPQHIGLLIAGALCAIACCWLTFEYFAIRPRSRNSGIADAVRKSVRTTRAKRFRLRRNLPNIYRPMA